MRQLGSASIVSRGGGGNGRGGGAGGGGEGGGGGGGGGNQSPWHNICGWRKAGGSIDSLTYAPPSAGAPSVKVAVVWVSSYLTLVAASNVADPPAGLILTCCDQYLRSTTWPSTHVPNLSCERVGSSHVSTSGTSHRGWAKGQRTSTSWCRCETCRMV